jgi:hypothetical protein
MSWRTGPWALPLLLLLLWVFGLNRNLISDQNPRSAAVHA